MIKDRSILFEGGGTGVLLVHGLGGTPIEVKSIGRRFVDTGATVLCCQLAGHCGSEADLVATSWADWYASVEAALASLEERCSTILVGGLSMGAILAARLAAKHPARVHGILMLAPTLWYDGWSTPWYRSLLRLSVHTPWGRRWRFTEQEPYGVKDERIRAAIARAMFGADSSEAGLPATPGASIYELISLIKDVKGRLGGIKQPTLIVHAREDDLAGLSNAFHLQRHLGGLVETLVLDDSYHLVTVDRQRDLVMERAAAFVMSLSTPEVQQKPRPLARHLRAV